MAQAFRAPDRHAPDIVNEVDCSRDAGRQTQTPDAPQGGRCLAIGDIHGCFDALTTLEAFVPFEADDCLITLGDYTSRGPDSRKVLDWLIARRALPKADRASPPKPRTAESRTPLQRPRVQGHALGWWRCGGITRS